MKKGAGMTVVYCLMMMVQGAIAFGQNKAPTEIPLVDQVTDIDRKIDELEAVKRGYLSKALRHEDQAERLQFDHDTWLEAKRHWQLAEENRAMAARVQIEIDLLKLKRIDLLHQSEGGQTLPIGGDGFEDL